VPIRRLLVVSSIIAILPLAAVSGQGPFPAPIGVRVPVLPTPVAGMGKTWLAYELHLSSFAPVPVTLSKIAVFADQGTAPVATWTGKELLGMRLWPSGKPDSTGSLAPGGFDVVFVWLGLPPGSRPASLRHVVTVQAAGTELSVEVPIAVNPPSDAPIFGPPLRGSGWVAAFGPANANGHQRTIVPIHGRAAVVQRYAIDFYRVDAAGHLFKGDTTSKKDYYAYGAAVLAVADGIIAAEKNDQPENELPHASRRAVPITLQTIGGNYVMLEVAPERYVFYAHLQTGSVRVKVGDRVRRGQVLGLLGLSGNTPAPHLHVHLGDTIEPIGSEGLPYVIDEFEVVGECQAPADLWGWLTSCRASAPDRRRNEIPLSWKLIRFAPDSLR